MFTLNTISYNENAENCTFYSVEATFIFPPKVFTLQMLERYYQNCQAVLAATGMNGLTLVLLVANLTKTKMLQKPEYGWNPGIWVQGTHLRVLSKSYPWSNEYQHDRV